MYTLPVYFLVGLLNIIAKRNNYDIQMEKNPDFDIRVKRSTNQEVEKENVILKRNRRFEERSYTNYNFNQLKMPYNNGYVKNGNQYYTNYNTNNYPVNTGYNTNYNNGYNTQKVPSYDPYNTNLIYDTNTYNPYYNYNQNTQKNYNNNEFMKNSNGRVYYDLNQNSRPSEVETTTLMNIVEGRIFNVRCPKGRKRVGFACVKISDIK